MSKHREKHSDKLVCCCKHSFSVCKPFLYSFHEILMKHLIIANYFYCHLPNYSAQISVASLGYSALSDIFAGLMNRRVQSGKGYHFFALSNLDISPPISPKNSEAVVSPMPLTEVIRSISCCNRFAHSSFRASESSCIFPPIYKSMEAF